MWSNRYNYYNIQSDLEFSQPVEYENVVRLLSDTNRFVQRNYRTFENCENFLWLNVTITMTEKGNFGTTEKESNHVNLISVVCLKGNDIEQSVYTAVLLNIAEKLNWKLFLEEDDFGNENIEITK